MSPATAAATASGAERQRGQRPVAFVTGASRGIGRQAALVLARAGYDVAFTARTITEGAGTVAARSSKDEQQEYAVSGSLHSTAHEIEAIGVRALPVRMDLLDDTDVRAAAEQVIGQWGRGTIVNICSGSAATDPPAPPGEGGWGVVYSASKAAFGRLAGAINAEFRPRGIQAFNLDPGFVVTDSGKARGGTGVIADRGFATTPEDVPGAVIAWLAQSPEAQGYLGKVIGTQTRRETRPSTDGASRSRC